MMNQIRIHTLLEHENIVRFVGFHYSIRISAILLEIGETNLHEAIVANKYCENQPMFIKFFMKISREIICGMVFSSIILQCFLKLIIDISS